MTNEERIKNLLTHIVEHSDAMPDTKTLASFILSLEHGPWAMLSIATTMCLLHPPILEKIQELYLVQEGIKIVFPPSDHEL